jgi:hypothetical protein
MESCRALDVLQSVVPLFVGSTRGLLENHVCLMHIAGNRAFGTAHVRVLSRETRELVSTV